MVKELANYYRRTCTRPQLADILREVIEQWFQTGIVVVRSPGLLYDDLIRHQTSIGWEQIFVGRFATEWKD